MRELVVTLLALLDAARLGLAGGLLLRHDDGLILEFERLMSCAKGKCSGRDW
jgi:hypothetical protein